MGGVVGGVVGVVGVTGTGGVRAVLFFWLWSTLRLSTVAVLTIGPVTSLATCTVTLSGGALCPTPKLPRVGAGEGAGLRLPRIVVRDSGTAPARAASRDERQPRREVVGDGERAVSHGRAGVRDPERVAPVRPGLELGGSGLGQRDVGRGHDRVGGGGGVVGQVAVSVLCS